MARLRIPMTKIAALGLFGVLASGCYKATFVENPADIEREPTHDEWSHHFLLGLVGDNEFDAGALCPHGASVVRTRGDAATGVVTIATLGVYSPRKVLVTCSDAKIAANGEKP